MMTSLRPPQTPISYILSTGGRAKLLNWLEFYHVITVLWMWGLVGSYASATDLKN